ncbi:hypothetical protein B0H14DRAFT_3462237 [Mycena olivaceomarginata]|nr:hypothetical protein B0H14DRAFT_3462237 [Mycena olivaceomarginata]
MYYNACLRRVGWHSRARVSPPRSLPRFTTTRSFDRDPPAPHGTRWSCTTSSTSSRTLPSAHNFDITHLLCPSAQHHPILILIPIRRGVRCSAHEERHVQEWQGRRKRTNYIVLGPSRSGWERKALATRGTGGSGRSIHTPRLSVPLRLQLQYTALPSHAALHFFSCSDVLPGLPFVPCPNLSSVAPHRPRPHCDSPLPCRTFLTPGASSPLLPFRRHEYQSISASGVPRARSLDKKPLRICGSCSSILSAGHSTERGAQHRAREKERVENRSPWLWMARPHPPLLVGAQWMLRTRLGRGVGLACIARGGVVGVGGPHVNWRARGGYDGARRVCPTSIIVARSSEACAPRGREAVRKARREVYRRLHLISGTVSLSVLESAEEEKGVVEAGAGEEDVETRTPLHLPRPHPFPLPLPSFFPPSRRPLPDMLFGFFASRPSAQGDPDLARRSPTRNLPRVCGAGWRRGKRSGSGSGSGSGRRRGRAAHVSPDAPPPAHRIGRVEEEREEGARWWMEMGMRKAHMMCVARLLLAPHASPARRGKGIGGEEDVWGATGARDGEAPPLRPLRVDYSSESTTASHNHPLLLLKPGWRACTPRRFASNGAWNEPSNLASTSPPDSTGSISTSVSSTHSALTDYEVEVIEIHVQEGEFDGIIP